MYYVYIYIDPKNQLPFYVGKGSGNRMYDHLKGKTCNRRMAAKLFKLKKEGLQPIIEIYKDGLSESNSYAIEESLIQKYGRRGYDKNGILMNICTDAKPPNNTGRKHTLETRKLMSQNSKGKNKGNIPWNKGIAHKRGAQTPEQTIKVMRAKIIKLCLELFKHFEIINDLNIQSARKSGIISKTSPISERAIAKYFNHPITYKEDILPYCCDE